MTRISINKDAVRAYARGTNFLKPRDRTKIVTSEFERAYIIRHRRSEKRFYAGEALAQACANRCDAVGHAIGRIR